MTHITQNYTVYVNIILMYIHMYIPIANEDFLFLVWKYMWAMTGELWPQNCVQDAMHSRSDTSGFSHTNCVYAGRGMYSQDMHVPGLMNACIMGGNEFAGN